MTSFGILRGSSSSGFGGSGRGPTRLAGPSTSLRSSATSVSRSATMIVSVFGLAVSEFVIHVLLVLA